MADPLIGRKLGDYKIIEMLGRGGMARVYKGYDEKLQRFAAVKVTSVESSSVDMAEVTERFFREARAIARLRHPNIVGVYQLDQFDDDQYFMAMAFIEGRDLRQILREYNEQGRRMPAEEILNIVLGIGSALDYAHSQGVIHRDVKTSNIMLDKDGTPILTDFGLVLSAWEGTLGHTFGSPHYIAPEQAVSSDKATAASDLYSLGICTYEMLVGKVPFDDPSAMSVALKHMHDTPPSPRTFVPTLAPAIDHAVSYTHLTLPTKA
jgi:serine/threonine-protein kinase